MRKRGLAIETRWEARKCTYNAWSQPLHHDIAWNFRSDIERKQDCQAIIVLQAMKVEIFLEIVESCISNVGAVQEAQPISLVSGGIL